MASAVVKQIAALEAVVQAEMKAKDFGIDELFAITIQLMVLLRSVKGLTGPEKKDVLLDVLVREVGKIKGGEKLVGIVEDVLPSVIEAFIFIAEKKFKGGGCGWC